MKGPQETVSQVKAPKELGPDGVNVPVVDEGVDEQLPVHVKVAVNESAWALGTPINTNSTAGMIQNDFRIIIALHAASVWLRRDQSQFEATFRVAPPVHFVIGCASCASQNDQLTLNLPLCILTVNSLGS